MRPTLIIAALVLTSACRPGPASDELSQSIQEVLDARFGAGTLEVSRLVRNGSYGFSPKDSEVKHLLLYFKSRLTVQKPYDFSQADKPGVGVLATLLGANPEGVEGIASGGNKSGDEIRVFGTIIYKEEDSGWVRVSRPREGGAAAPEETGMFAVLTDLSERARKYQNRRKDDGFQIIESEVLRAERRIALRLDHIEGRLSLLTGAAGGEYNRLGEGLAETFEPEGSLSHYPSAGSVENCRSVGAGEASLALAQADIALQAYTGNGPFERDGPQKNLRIAAALYPEAIQVVVRRDSEIRSLAELVGRRVDLGPSGSGTHAHATTVMNALGLSVEQLGAVSNDDPMPALQRLRESQIDAVWLTAFFPNASIESAAAGVGVRLLPIDGEAAQTIQRAAPYLQPVQIPGSTYSGVDQPSPTLGVQSVLLTHDLIPNEDLTPVLDTLFRDPAALSRHSLAASLLKKESTNASLPLPLHDAASKYFNVVLPSSEESPTPEPPE